MFADMEREAQKLLQTHTRGLYKETEKDIMNPFCNPQKFCNSRAFINANYVNTRLKEDAYAKDARKYIL